MGQWTGIAEWMEDSQCVPCESFKKICVWPYQTSPRPTTSYSGRRKFGGIRTNIEDMNIKKRVVTFFYWKKHTFDEVERIFFQWCHLRKGGITP